MAKEESGNNKVVTRIPPSPTGPMHIGTVRAALFNFLYARKYEGKFLLRVEDTDRERSSKEYEQDIFTALEWLDMPPDEWVRQSERGDIYEKYLNKLIESGNGYLSKEESRESPGEEVEVVRLRNPGQVVGFDDSIRGRVTFDTTELGDFVVAKSMRQALYHFAVVVDDYEMGVTDVIRGEDHVSNTPRQILIQEALDLSRPNYAHLPMILAEDKSKLSKRKGQVSVSEYMKQGYLPEAVINFLALLGWGPGDDREFFTREQLIKEFDIKNIQKSGAVFNIDKLKWFNKEYLRELSSKEFLDGVEEHLPKDFKQLPDYNREQLARAISVIRERINVFYEVKEMAEAGELQFFFEKPDYEVDSLMWKDANLETTKKHLQNTHEMIKEIPENDFSYSSIKNKIWDYASNEGRGEVLWPFRYSLSGRDKSPDPFEIASIIGKKETLQRVEYAIDKIQNYGN